MELYTALQRSPVLIPSPSHCETFLTGNCPRGWQSTYLDPILFIKETFTEHLQYGRPSYRVYVHVCWVTSAVSNSLRPMDCSPPGSSDHRILQAGILEVGSHALLQKIFLIHGLNLHLLYHRQIIYPLSHLGSPIQVLDVNKSKKTWSLLLSSKH